MRTIQDLAVFILPVLFVLLSVRMAVASIGPLLLPLVAIAFVALVAWLWLGRRR